MAKLVGENGTIRARIITPGQGSSGYYSSALLEKSAQKFDGVQVYWDHPTTTEAATRPERSLRDLAGKVMAGTVTFESKGKDGAGIYGDVQVYKPFQEAVNELGPDIGLSIRGSARGKPGKIDGKEAMVIESIDSIASVDFVTLPGRGGKILQMFEAARGSNTTQQQTQEAIEMTAEEAKALIQTAVSEAVAPLHERIRKDDAREEARKLLESVTLPPAAKVRIIERACAVLPMKDGQLDLSKLRESVVEESKAEGKYLAEVTGSGRVVGMGSAPVSIDSKEARKEEKRRRKEAERIEEAGVDAFRALGMPKKAARLAAGMEVA